MCELLKELETIVGKGEVVQIIISLLTHTYGFELTTFLSKNSIYSVMKCPLPHTSIENFFPPSSEPQLISSPNISSRRRYPPYNVCNFLVWLFICFFSLRVWKHLSNSSCKIACTHHFQIGVLYFLLLSSCQTASPYSHKSS